MKQEIDIKNLKKLLEKNTNNTLLVECQKINNSGSNRQYYRILDNQNQSYIGVVGTSKEENRAFIQLCQHFTKLQLPVPHIIAYDNDNLCYIQQDLGNLSLFDKIKVSRESGKYREEDIALIQKSLHMLADFQIKGSEQLDKTIFFPQQQFDRHTIAWDLNYFKYCFLKGLKLEFNEEKLEADFEHLTKIILKEQSNYFLYRDFQSRNIMLLNNQPYGIDFQSGRFGPLQYDLVSFLWQAKANINQQLRDYFIDYYLDYASSLTAINREHFKQSIPYFVLLRTLQVLGAYGYRGFFERKKHFLESVPLALQNAEDVLKIIGNDFIYLKEIIGQVIKTFLENKSKDNYSSTAQSNLTVRVFSFSFKRGIPEDRSTNGGGFVFDCRAMHNPGKYDEYKQLTGLDQPVIDFLEKDGEILRFLDNVYQLVDASVERYIQRGFTDLMVSFGCTGGQHRSAYSAQHLAEHLHNKYGIAVELHHRELGKHYLFDNHPDN